MDTSFHYLLMATHALFQKQVLAELSHLGLTAGQPKVLDYLGLHNGSMQKNIAEGCQIDPATLTGILNRMEEKGLLERRTMDGNRRSFHIYLTELGWQWQKEVMDAFHKWEDELFRHMEPSKREALTGILRALCEKMTDIEVLQ